MPTLSPGVAMTWLMDDTIQPNAGLSLARMTVEPGVISAAHRHPNCSEAIHVVLGLIEQRRGDAWVRLAAGETTLVPAGTIHQTRNVGPETAVLMIAYSSGSRAYESAD